MKRLGLPERFMGGRICAVEHALAVAEEVLAHWEKCPESPDLFDSLYKALDHNEALVRARAAYAISKIASQRAELVKPYKNDLIGRLFLPEPGAIARACMLQTLPYLELNVSDVHDLKDLLKEFMLSESSSIVKTSSMQLLYDFASQHEELRQEIMLLVWDALERGTPAMRARARKLLKPYKLG